MFRRTTATVALLGLTACTLPEGFGQDLWDVATLAAQEYAQAKLAKQAGSEVSQPTPTDAPVDVPTDAPIDAPADAPTDASATPEPGEPVSSPEQALPEPTAEPPAEPPAAAPTAPARKVRRAEDLRLRALRALRKLGEPK